MYFTNCGEWIVVVQVPLSSHRKPVELHKSHPEQNLQRQKCVSTSTHLCLKCFCFFMLKHIGQVVQFAFNLGGKTMGWLPWQYAPNCCYMVLEGYMLLLFVYVVAYFPDLGTVGNNDCCCRSNDVGNFFFLFHIYLLALSRPPDPPSFYLSLISPPISSVETPFSDSLTPPSVSLTFCICTVKCRRCTVSHILAF